MDSSLPVTLSTLAARLVVTSDAFQASSWKLTPSVSAKAERENKSIKENSPIPYLAFKQAIVYANAFFIFKSDSTIYGEHESS